MAELSPRRIPKSDVVLVALWLLATAWLCLGVGIRLAAYLQYESWTTMWESGPLVAAWEVVEGRPLYAAPVLGGPSDRTVHPVPLVIYGPLYYEVIGRLGRLFDCNRIELIQVGRWVGISGMLLAMAAAVIWMRLAPVPWWALVLPLIAMGLLTPTAVRFIGSARPDALAAGLSISAAAISVWRNRWSVFVSVGLCLAAAMVKQSAFAATISIPLAMWISSRRAGALMFAGSYLAAMMVILALLHVGTNDLFWSHFLGLSVSQTSWRYAWQMLADPTPAHDVWVMLAWAAVLMITGLMMSRHSAGGKDAHPACSPETSVGKGMPVRLPEPSGKSSLKTPDYAWRLAVCYWTTSFILALLFGFSLGSDQNYLIEPVFAFGPMFGLWAVKIARVQPRKKSLLMRAAAWLMLINPPILHVNDHLEWPFDAAEAANVLDNYGPEDAAWYAGLPSPKLSLDPWLAYLSGERVWINDPIAYGWLAESCAGGDFTSRMIENTYFAVIVCPTALENSSQSVYRGIPLVTPSLVREIDDNYVESESTGRWWVYVPKSATKR